MSQKSQHVLFTAFQVIVDQALKTKTIHELWEKMQLLTSLSQVFAKSPERKTLISNSQMKSLWDVYLKLLKSEYLDCFYPEKTEQEIAEMLEKKITDMDEQKIAKMCENARIRGFRIHGSRIQESEQEIAEMWKNFPKASRNRKWNRNRNRYFVLGPKGRHWDPWILGVFFNPMFWFQDYRRFFDKTHCDEFNQYIKNVFQTLRATIAGGSYLSGGSGDTFHSEEDAEECAVFNFCDYIVHDIEVMDNCHIMPTKWGYKDEKNDDIHKEARLQYTTPNHEKRQILCLITNRYNEEPVDTRYERAAYYELQYDYSKIQIFDSDKFNEQ